MKLALLVSVLVLASCTAGPLGSARAPLIPLLRPLDEQEARTALGMTAVDDEGRLVLNKSGRLFMSAGREVKFPSYTVELSKSVRERLEAGASAAFGACSASAGISFGRDVTTKLHSVVARGATSSAWDWAPVKNACCLPSGGVSDACDPATLVVTEVYESTLVTELQLDADAAAKVGAACATMGISVGASKGLSQHQTVRSFAWNIAAVEPLRQVCGSCAFSDGGCEDEKRLFEDRVAAAKKDFLEKHPTCVEASDTLSPVCTRCELAFPAHTKGGSNADGHWLELRSAYGGVCTGFPSGAPLDVSVDAVTVTARRVQPQRSHFLTELTWRFNETTTTQTGGNYSDKPDGDAQATAALRFSTNAGATGVVNVDMGLRCNRGSGDVMATSCFPGAGRLTMSVVPPAACSR